ncbi:hypothetical protein EPN16_02670 [bacterium]|nr:MAG: hypothetical protein EPN16_02670 [bacterium]
MKNAHTLTRKVFFLAVIIFLSLSRLAICQEKKASHPAGWFSKKEFSACVNFLKNPDLYNRAISYIQRERRERAGVQPEQGKAIVLIFTDLFLSLSALCLTLRLIAGVKTFLYKKYLWFLFILNFGWFILLTVFKGVWEALYFMVIRLEPGLFGVIQDNFTLMVIAFSFFAYQWLLARTFSLRFFGALRVLFVSHLFYLIAAFILFISLSFTGTDWPQALKENIGPSAMAKGCISDIGKISARGNVLSLFRLRAFHL